MRAMRQRTLYSVLAALLIALAVAGCGTEELTPQATPDTEPEQAPSPPSAPPLPATPFWLPEEALVVLTAPTVHDLIALTEQALEPGSNPVGMLSESGLALDAPCAIALDIGEDDTSLELLYAVAARVADPNRLRIVLQDQPDWRMFGGQAWSDGQTLALHGDWVVLGTAPELMQSWGRQLAALEGRPAAEATALYLQTKPLQAVWPQLVREAADRYGWGGRVRETVAGCGRAFDGESPLVAEIEREQDGFRADLVWHHAHHPNLQAVLGDTAPLPSVEWEGAVLQLALSGVAREIVGAMLRDEAAGTRDSDAVAYVDRLENLAGDALVMGWEGERRWLALRGGADLDSLCREYLPIRPDRSVAIGQPAFYRYDGGFAVLSSQPQSPESIAETTAADVPRMRWAMRWAGARNVRTGRAIKMESDARVTGRTDVWTVHVTFVTPQS